MRTLIDAAAVQQRVDALAQALAADYPSDMVVFVGVLTGAAQFMMQLMGSLPASMQARVLYDFVDVSSYQGDTSSGQVVVHKDCTVQLTDRHVVVVDGVVDTGLTLDRVLKMLGAQRPRSLRVCTLVDKPGRRVHQVPVDYNGFVMGDEFIVGCGMDYNQCYRALDFIGVLEQSDTAANTLDGGMSQ
jgi:hypoxanthine phosphoribosyltransferase